MVRLDRDRAWVPSPLPGPFARTALPHYLPKDVDALTTPAPRPRKDCDGGPSGGRALENGPTFLAQGAHVNGTDHPIVRAEPVLHTPRKMRVVIASGAPADSVASRGSGLTRGPREPGRASLTTGQTHRNGRGLTSGWGMVNGTGMVREAEFHRSAGRFNGSCVTYRHAVLGSRDGMTNGSGLTEAGPADDAGLTNGCGLTQGEGMTNGCGLAHPPDPTAPVPLPVPVPAPARRRGLRAMLGM